MAETVQIKLDNAPNYSSAVVKRIDDAHANPKQIWQKMNKPEYLTASEVNHLTEASRLTEAPFEWQYNESALSFEIDLSPH